MDTATRGTSSTSTERELAAQPHTVIDLTKPHAQVYEVGPTPSPLLSIRTRMLILQLVFTALMIVCSSTSFGNLIYLVMLYHVSFKMDKT